MSDTRMHAISQDEYGGPEVLRLVEATTPEPGPGEVLVRVRAAGVNPADWRIRSGEVRRFGDPPLTVGLDLAGTVVSAGAETTAFQPGDDVYGCAFPPRGAYAEYAVAAATALAQAPRGIDVIEAGAMPVTALTAWQSLVHVAAVAPGQRVLVHAAAGGIGHLAVQIAKSRGAFVIGTARRSKHDFLRSLGADELIDYTETDFATAVTGVDVVLDPISGDYGVRSLTTLAPGGMLVDVRGSGPDRTVVRQRAAAHGVRLVEFGFTPSGVDLAAIAGEVEQGRLRVVVQKVLPLAEAATAHELSETSTVQGKVVLTP